MMNKTSAKDSALNVLAYWGERVMYNTIRERKTVHTYQGTIGASDDISALVDAKRMACALGASDQEVLSALESVEDSDIEAKVLADLDAEDEMMEATPIFARQVEAMEALADWLDAEAQ